MRQPIAIENIEEMRRREGIKDVELRKAIRGLEVGDFVKITLLTGAPSSAGETLLVEITGIKGREFLGKLTSRPTSAGLSKLKAGSPLTFTTAHIHSLRKGQSTNGK
jgi:hypothetical protein